MSHNASQASKMPYKHSFFIGEYFIFTTPKTQKGGAPVRFRGQNFWTDIRGDAMLIFVIFLFSLFGMMLAGYSNITGLSITRQKLYNAVQDGLTLARALAIRMDGKNVIFDDKTAYILIQQSLANNRIQVTSLSTWYAGGRIYASGRTAQGTAFKYSIQVHKNFD